MSEPIIQLCQKGKQRIDAVLLKLEKKNAGRVDSAPADQEEDNGDHDKQSRNY